MENENTKMTTELTSADVQRISVNSGLMSCIFKVANDFPHDEHTRFCEKVLALVNSSQVRLFTEVDRDFLSQIQGPEFFQGVELLCELLPSMDADRNEVRDLVETLVLRARDDLAAYMPYTAFKSWCKNHPQEALLLIEEAVCTDGYSVEYISRLFEGLNDVDTALNTIGNASNSNLLSGISVALGRMNLSDEQASMVIRVLSEVSLASNDINVWACSLLSSYAILGKNDTVSRDLPGKAVIKMIENGSPQAMDALASLLCNHGKVLSDDEWALITTNLKAVSVSNTGVLKKINSSAFSAKSKCAFLALADLIRHLICKANGKLGLENFALFERVLFDTKESQLSKVVVQWLMDGNFHVCKALEQAFSKEVSKTIEVQLEADDLPNLWHEQLFLCRKAVGWFFSKPITAASVLITVLEYGHEEIWKIVCDMLEYPLLVNYNDVIRGYLEEKMEQNPESLGARIQPVLDRTERLYECLQLVKKLPELQPSEIEQNILSALEQEQFLIGWRSVEANSILHEIVPQKHLIYGNTWATYVRQDDENLVLQSQRLVTHSVRVEYPQIKSLDHARLSKLLLIFRNEHRAKREADI